MVQHSWRLDDLCGIVLVISFPVHHILHRLASQVQLEVLHKGLTHLCSEEKHHFVTVNTCSLSLSLFPPPPSLPQWDTLEINLASDDQQKMAKQATKAWPYYLHHDQRRFRTKLRTLTLYFRKSLKFQKGQGAWHCTCNCTRIGTQTLQQWTWESSDVCKTWIAMNSFAPCSVWLIDGLLYLLTNLTGFAGGGTLQVSLPNTGLSTIWTHMHIIFVFTYAEHLSRGMKIHSSHTLSNKGPLRHSHWILEGHYDLWNLIGLFYFREHTHAYTHTHTHTERNKLHVSSCYAD